MTRPEPLPDVPDPGTRHYHLYSTLDDCTPPAAPLGVPARPTAPTSAETGADATDAPDDSTATDGSDESDDSESGLSVEIVFDDWLTDREQIAAALEAAFADDGEITGAGRSAMGGGHIDMAINSGMDRDQALDRIDSVLEGLGVSETAEVIAYG